MNKAKLMAFGQIVYEKRIKKKWTQDDLAKNAKTKQPTISRIEKGTMRNLGINLIENIATALDCSIAELLGERDPNKDPFIQEAVTIMEPMSELQKSATLGAIKGIRDGMRKAG